MHARRQVSSDVSAALLQYVLKQSSLSQEKLADALEVSPAFISRVRAKERSFTLDHLATLETLLNVPLGALLLAAIPLPKPRPETKKLHKLVRQAILQADIASKSLSKRFPSRRIRSAVSA